MIVSEDRVPQRVSTSVSIDRERVLNSTNGNLEEMNVQGLQPGTKYLLRVFARNQHGSGDSSKQLMVTI